MLAGNSLGWVASGEQVLARQPARGGARRRSPVALSVPAVPAGRRAPDLAVFFRDDKLSDRIGFEYQKWYGSDAAANSSVNWNTSRRKRRGRRPLVSVILDGENAWEHYPYNAYYFLTALYKALESHPSIRSTTYAAFLQAGSNDAGASRRAARRDASLERLVAGSWVSATSPRG